MGPLDQGITSGKQKWRACAAVVQVSQHIKVCQPETPVTCAGVYFLVLKSVVFFLLKLFLMGQSLITERLYLKTYQIENIFTAVIMIILKGIS